MISSFIRAIGVFGKLLDVEKSADVTKLADALTNFLKDPSRLFSIPKELSAFMEGLNLLQTTVLETVGLDQSTCDLLSKMMESVGLILKDKEGDLVLIGEAWTHMGLLFMKLLAPQGPVDPVEKNMTKLNIAIEQVGY